MLGKAIAFASLHHQEQRDKRGEPYILHPMRILVSGKMFLNARVRDGISVEIHDSMDTRRLTQAVLEVMQYHTDKVLGYRRELVRKHEK